jgi:hypothetical protein
MTVDASGVGAYVFADDAQLELFSAELSCRGTVLLVWRDPPPDRRVVLTPEIIGVLRASPGRWAVVRAYRTGTAANGWGRRVKHPVDIELRGVAEPPGSVLYARAKVPGDAR